MKFKLLGEHILLEGILLSPKELVFGSDWYQHATGQIYSLQEVEVDRVNNTHAVTLRREDSGHYRLQTVDSFRLQREFSLVINKNCTVE